MPEDHPDDSRAGRAPVELAIWSARPPFLLEAARDAIDGWLGVTGAEVMLIDYHQSHLVPFGDGTGGSAIPVDAHPAGRAYASVRPVPDEDHLYLPLAVYGERSGVLAVRLPAEADPGLPDELALVADTLARALRLADTATDVYREVRRRKRLTIAAELQWELLPGRTCSGQEFSLAGQLEPAYTVCGDNFDWSQSRQFLTLSVTAGMGSGIGAALLTQLTVNSLRNARRSAASPAEAAELANGIVYSQYGGKLHSSTLMLRIALTSGEAEVVDAGSPRMLRVRRGDVELLTFDEQMPLGMFSDTRYRTQSLSLAPGDRLIIVSDGLYNARNPSGRVYGRDPLGAALRSARMQDPNETVRFIISDLLAHHDGSDLANDAIAVCLDWAGAADHPVTSVSASTDLADLIRPGDTSPDVMT
ncbi:MAG TPA: PP2C family protein-serine/threonine phosphatase [Streptosporangiaceae bacterium]|jgi:serine phosphatase RsbU (regulator of sigma subunit)|nr:PP2C family protein-serine/threonine phosphatase [Streptosporangiaceae bacterium]